MKNLKSNYRRKNNKFSNITLSKVVFLALSTVVPNHFVNELIKIQSNFISKNTSPKIKHKTLILENFGLKYVDVTFKVKSLSCLWVKRLFDESFYEWKILPLFYLKKAFGSKFHFNLTTN